MNNLLNRLQNVGERRSIRNAVSLTAALTCCSLVLLYVTVNGQWGLFQPDTRYMVAIGNWICANGRVPETDPLTLSPGLEYVCQQWLMCVIAAKSYGMFGEAGITGLFLVIDLAAVACVWWATLSREGASGSLHCLSCCAFAVILAWMVGSTPRGVDIAALAISYRTARTWTERCDDRLLAVFPALGLAIANLHGALWTVPLMVPACLLLDRRLDREERLKVLTAVGATVGCTLLNPYGLRILAVPFLTMGAHSLDSINIEELKPWFAVNPVGASTGIAFAAGLIALSLMKRERVPSLLGNIRYGDLLVCGTLALALMNMRNSLLLYAALVLALSDITESIAAPSVSEDMKRVFSIAAPVAFWVLACAVGFTVSGTVRYASLNPSAQDAREAIAALEAAGLSRGNNVIADIDVGSELDLLGYCPLLDTRAELFCREVNGGTDAWGLALDALGGDKDAIEQCNARYAVLTADSYPAAEKALTELGYNKVCENGRYVAYAL